MRARRGFGLKPETALRSAAALRDKHASSFLVADAKPNRGMLSQLTSLLWIRTGKSMEGSRLNAMHVSTGVASRLHSRQGSEIAVGKSVRVIAIFQQLSPR